MIVEVKKDLLASEADIIAHQTNCVGVMGAGVAKQIKGLLSEKSFNKYVRLCNEHGKNLLGNVQFLFDKNGNRLVANLFGENIPTGIDVDTDYNAIKEALKKLEAFAASSGMSIAIPGYIGCGLAGGDWKIVYDMIYTIFKDSPIEVEICYFPGDCNVNLPKGYKWNHWEDGSGSITGPKGETYFSYDRQPYMNVDGVEYKKDDSSDWTVFWDGFGEFKKYAEAELRKKVQEEIKSYLINEYQHYSVEFSSAFLDIPAGDMSLLEAVELYVQLQYTINKDYVYLVKDAVIEEKNITGGTICAFDTVFSAKDKVVGKTITELLEIAEEKAKEADMMLIRADWVDTDIYPEDGAFITDGEIMDFLF